MFEISIIEAGAAQRKQMDSSGLIAPLIGLIAPIVISAIRRPASRIQDRKERLQYWKAFFEVAPLAGSTVSDETKELCLAELTETEDEVRNLSNKFVSSITTMYTIAVMFFFTALIDRGSIALLDQMDRQYHSQQPPPVTPQQFKDVIERLEYGSLIVQVLLMCLLWFWARWKIRDFVWNGLRPGKLFHFLLNLNNRLKALTELILIFALIGAMDLITSVVWQLPQSLQKLHP